MGAVAPFVALQMWFTGRPLVLRMDEDARLRFKVEDLARELEETRDEALKQALRGGNRQRLQDRLPGQYEP